MGKILGSLAAFVAQHGLNLYRVVVKCKAFELIGGFPIAMRDELYSPKVTILSEANPESLRSRDEDRTERLVL
jgi:hypothetical protein